MSWAIQLNHVSHRFGLTWALRDLSFSVGGGECVAVLGPNASGKTTLLKILATRLKPTRGEISILGHSLKQDAAKIREHVEWLGPELALYKNLSAEENLTFHFKLRGERPEPKKIAAALDKVDLNGKVGKPVAAFSSGQKKRLALARVLLTDSKIILLDEPHTHLDEAGRKLMNNLIAEWKKEGKTLLLASHDRQETAPFCDRTITL